MTRHFKMSNYSWVVTKYYFIEKKKKINNYNNNNSVVGIIFTLSIFICINIINVLNKQHYNVMTEKRIIENVFKFSEPEKTFHYKGYQFYR